MSWPAALSARRGDAGGVALGPARAGAPPV